jgi:hypothetical protein
MKYQKNTVFGLDVKIFLWQYFIKSGVSDVPILRRIIDIADAGISSTGRLSGQQLTGPGFKDYRND